LIRSSDDDDRNDDDDAKADRGVVTIATSFPTPSTHGLRMPDTSDEIDRERERVREIRDDLSGWRRWGPYLSDRSWGSVREDYSEDGNAWMYLSYDKARAKAYRWGEDGIAGICDRYQLLCFAPAFWNERDG